MKVCYGLYKFSTQAFAVNKSRLCNAIQTCCGSGVCYKEVVLMFVCVPELHEDYVGVSYAQKLQKVYSGT